MFSVTRMTSLWFVRKKQVLHASQRRVFGSKINHRRDCVTGAVSCLSFLLGERVSTTTIAQVAQVPCCVSLFPSGPGSDCLTATERTTGRIAVLNKESKLNNHRPRWQMHEYCTRNDVKRTFASCTSCLRRKGCAGSASRESERAP